MSLTMTNGCNLIRYRLRKFRKNSCRTFGVRPSQTVAVWCSGNALVLINAVALHRARLVLGWVTVIRVGKLSHYVTSHPGQLSLAIPPWVGEIVLTMVTATVREENGEFCVAVAPATRTASILTWLVKGAGCQIEPAIRPI